MSTGVTLGTYLGSMIHDFKTKNDTASKALVSIGTMGASAKLIFLALPKLTMPEYLTYFSPASFSMGACAYHWSGLLECLPIELRPMTRHLEAAVLTLTFQQVITDCAQGLSGGAVATRAAWNLFVGQAAPLTWEGLALLKRKLSQLF